MFVIVSCNISTTKLSGGGVGGEGKRGQGRGIIFVFVFFLQKRSHFVIKCVLYN